MLCGLHAYNSLFLRSILDGETDARLIQAWSDIHMNILYPEWCGCAPCILIYDVVSGVVLYYVLRRLETFWHLSLDSEGLAIAMPFNCILSLT